MRKRILFTLAVSSLVLLTACQGNEVTNSTLPTPTDFVRTENPTEVPVPTSTQIPTPTVRTENEENLTNATPTEVPTSTPTSVPTIVATATPTEEPIATPTNIPTSVPTIVATATPTMVPTSTPTPMPTVEPTIAPTEVPNITVVPTETPIATVAPTSTPTPMPTATATPIPTTTVEPTATPSPTATPTVAPTATPKPTPIPGDDIGVTFDGTVTLDCGVEIPKLSDYNTAGLYSKDTKIYGWFGDGQDNRDNGSLVGDKMDELENAIGVTASNGTGFYVSNFSAEFYWGGVGSTPDLALYRDVDNGCYYLAINYDISERVRNYEDRDVLRMLLSICSSNPIELEADIYNLTFGDSNIGLDEWVETADVKVCCESTNPVNGLCVITIVQN